VLVVVNFDHRRFDILSSEYGADKTMRVINSSSKGEEIISVNFQ
jgi:hypothetical protein